MHERANATIEKPELKKTYSAPLGEARDYARSQWSYKTHALSLQRNFGNQIIMRFNRDDVAQTKFNKGKEELQRHALESSDSNFEDVTGRT